MDRHVRQLLMPTEHGAWAWLAVPYFVGLAVATLFGEAQPGAAPAALFVFVGGLALFLSRQPVAAWLRIRRGKGSRARLPLVTRLMGLTLGLALISLVGLLLLGRTQLLTVGVAALILLSLYGYATLMGRAGMRSLFTELAGAAGLSLTVAAAIVAVIGRMPASGWWLYVLLAAYNMLGVLYVRVRLADTRGRPARRTPMVLWHLLALLLATILAALKLVPLLAILPFAGVFVRALWAGRRERPVASVKRFGFTELGLSIVMGAVLAIGYWIG